MTIMFLNHQITHGLKSWYLKRRGEIKYGHQKYQKRRWKTPGLHWLRKRGGELSYGFIYSLNQHPLATSLDELVEHQAHITQCEPANVKAKELSSMSCAEFQANMGFRRMFESRVLNLLSNLFW